MSQINTIAANMPIANKQLEQQRKAASTLQLQQAVAAQPATVAGPAAAQQMGAALTQQQGQQQVQQAATQQQQQGQLGGMALQEKAAGLQESISKLQEGGQESALSQEKQLGDLSADAKREMFDSRKQFATDEMGRKYLNDRQMADYMVLNARTEQEQRNYMQASNQAHQRNIQSLEYGQQLIEQKMKQEYALGKQKQDQGLMRELTEAKVAMDKRIAKARADAANNSGMLTSILTIGGAVVGGIYGGPMGAAAGASLGGAVGGAIASDQNRNQEI